MNYGKLAMLHRVSGNQPITVYSSSSPADLTKLYDYLQELCHGSHDLQLQKDRIVTGNPFLAWHLQEVVSAQTIVPVEGGEETEGCCLI